MQGSRRPSGRQHWRQCGWARSKCVESPDKRAINSIRDRLMTDACGKDGNQLPTAHALGRIGCHDATHLIRRYLLIRNPHPPTPLINPTTSGAPLV